MLKKVKLSLGLCALLILTTGCTKEFDENDDITEVAKTWVETCKDWDDWDKPAPPFRLYGNSYYVGTCGITAVLITGSDGHILIDGATEAGADVIAANIKTLGFNISDVKLLLHSHEHFDHVAGLAKLQRLSGAKLLASEKAAPVLRTGISIEADPQAGLHEPFPASRVDGIVQDGEDVVLGDLVLNAIATPGHTPGALSWQWRSCVDNECKPIVFADSLSAISRDEYYFSDHPKYVAAYKTGIAKLAAQDCQILVSSHPSASKMRDRLVSDNGLVNPSGCEMYANKTLKYLNKRLLKEKKAKEQL